MIKNRFVKNLYQIVSFAFSEIVLILPLLASIFLAIQNNAEEAIWILATSIVFLIVLYFVIGFYWIFQIIEISKEGIEVKLFKKTIRRIKWEDVKEIKHSQVMRNPAYSIVVNGTKNLNLDSRKKIKLALDFFGNEKAKWV